MKKNFHVWPAATVLLIILSTIGPVWVEQVARWWLFSHGILLLLPVFILSPAVVAKLVNNRRMKTRYVLWNFLIVIAALWAGLYFSITVYAAGALLINWKLRRGRRWNLRRQMVA
ncbi:MAG: hypothetical protein R3180_00205 [Marinobacter sp.]|nr:hypothetical protein [Marinobacter sp.]